MSDTGKGLAGVLAATTMWGLATLYWKALAGVPALLVLGHRSFWSLVVFGAIFALQGRLGEVGRLLRGPQGGRVLFAAVTVSANWGLYIWAIQVERTVEASFGYYIYPLVMVLFGVLVYRERLGRAAQLAVALAAFAVAVLGIGLGTPPWVALALAITFAAYGIAKKGMRAGPIASVLAEVLLATPVIAIWVLWREGGAVFAPDLVTNLLLIGAGPVTAIPLILFSYGAQRLPLSTTGLVFYINPTLQFLVATVVFGEPMTRWHLIAFPLIWAAVAIYSGATLTQDRAERRRVISAGTSGTTLR